MADQIRAKAQAMKVEDNGHSESIQLWAVKGDGDNAEDNAFATATPFLKLEMSIDNPTAKGFIKPNKKYYIDITEAPE